MRKIEPRDIMRFYVNYFDIEKKIIEDVTEAFRCQDYNICENSFHIYLHNYMKIGRNFKRKGAFMVYQTIENMLFNEGNLGVEELSDRYVRNEVVSNPAIKNVKVAASKLLWLFDKKTIIMDNNNMKLLKAKDYSDYIKAWQNLFDSKLNEINEIIKIHFNNLDEIVNENWFKMRIFDQYLWSVFEEQRKV